MKKLYYLLLVALISSPGIFAQTLQTDFWVPDETVFDIHVKGDGSTVFLGGSFKYFKDPNYTVPNEYGLGLSAANGTYNSAFSAADGQVTAVVEDGSGGFYVAGLFNNIGGVARPHLAHVLNSGAVDQAFNAQIIMPGGGTIKALDFVDGKLYVAGDFAGVMVNGNARSYLFAVDATTGAVDTNFNPNIDGSVNALGIWPKVMTGDRFLYFGGAFGNVEGSTRSCLAAIKLTDNSLTVWDPNVEHTTAGLDPVVNSIAMANDENLGWIYVGGKFNRLNGSQTRKNLCRFNGVFNDGTGTGVVLGWTPDATHTTDATNEAVHSVALSADDSYCYAVGHFDRLGKNNATRLGAGSVNTESSAPDYEEGSTWNPMAVNELVSKVVVNGNKLLMVGPFAKVEGQARDHLASFDISTPGTPSLDAWDASLKAAEKFAMSTAPTVVASNGTNIFVDGKYVREKAGSLVIRNGIAEIDASNGVPTSTFTPVIKGSVNTIALKPDGSSVFVGGALVSVNGTAREHLAEIQTSDGSLTSFNATNVAVAEPQFLRINNAGNTLYYKHGNDNVHSVFTNGTANAGFNFAGTVSQTRHLEISPNDQMLMTGQNDDPYNSIVNPTTGALLTGKDMYDKAFNAGAFCATSDNVKSYFGGNFEQFDGQAQKHLAKFINGNWVSTFSPDLDAAVRNVIEIGAYVYIYGQFSAANGVSRTGFAVLDTATGTVTNSFDLQLDAGSSTGPAMRYNPSTNMMYLADNTWGSILGDTKHPYFAAFTVEASNTVSAFNDGPGCEGSDIELQATDVTGATYSWTGPGGYTSTDQKPVLSGVTMAQAGTYTVTADVGGVQTMASTDVVVTAPPAAPTASANGPICDGQNLTLTASDVAGATYDWSGPNAYTSTDKVSTITSASMAAAGTYKVIAIVDGCNSPEAEVVVVVNAIPAATVASGGGNGCVGQDISLEAAAVTGASYSWGGPNGFNSTNQNATVMNLSAASAGNYKVVVVVDGCESDSSNAVSVSVDSAGVVPSGTIDEVCEGGNLYFTGDYIAGASYHWTGPNGFVANDQYPFIDNVSAAAGGTYKLKVMYNGCYSEEVDVVATVHANTIDINLTKTDASCGNANGTAQASISGGTLPYNFYWSHGPTTSGVSNLSAETYQINVTDANNCMKKGFVDVGNVDGPSITSIDIVHPGCQTASDGELTANVSGGTAPLTYSWDTPNYDATAVVTDLIEGFYTVSVTDASGCEVRGSVELEGQGDSPKVHGQVIFDGSPATSGMVEIFDADGTENWYSNMGSAYLGAGGQYNFAYLEPGDYIMVATLDAASYPTAVKTYYDLKHKWTDSDLIFVDCDSTKNIDFNVIKKPASGGNARVSGRINNATSGAESPVVAGVDVFLEDDATEDIVDATVTDSLGMYEFTDVGDGDYSIFVDMPGIGMVQTHTMSVTSVDTLFENKDFYVDSTGMINTVLSSESVEEISVLAASNVFPNPTTEFINIQYELDNQGRVHVGIYDMMGTAVSELENNNERAGVHKRLYNAAHLQPGVYLVKITVNNEVQTHSIVKL